VPNGLGLVWRETDAVRNARPSRGQAASNPEEGGVGKDGVAFRLRLLEGMTKNGLVGEEQFCKWLIAMQCCRDGVVRRFGRKSPGA